MSVQVPLWSDLPGALDQVLAANNTGSNDKDNSKSLYAVVAAFVPALITAILFLLAFILVRTSFSRTYSPRTFIDTIPEKHRTPASPTSRFDWVRTLATTSDKFILEHSSLDAFLYLRFLRTAIFLCFAGLCLTWPILLPVNAQGGGTASQLDKLGIGNVHDGRKLHAHAVVAWLLYGFVMFVIARERIWLVGLRQAWHLSKHNAARLSSRTVLFLDPPRGTALDADVQSNFGHDARRQWVVSPSASLTKAVGQRDGKAAALESAQVTFLENVTQARAKAASRGGAGSEQLDRGNFDAQRPLHREYRFFGPATDAISRTRGELKKAIETVDQRRTTFSGSRDPDHSAIFVEYTSQSAAQLAYRDDSEGGRWEVVRPSVQHRLIGVAPSEVLWTNVAHSQTTRLSQKSVANALIVLLIIFWSIPTSLIGLISNVTYLAEHVKWLHWIGRLPDSVLGLLSGLLPPLLTSLFASYVPNFMRYIARSYGQPTTVSSEIQVQNWFYAFQLIQVFLVTALSSSATAFIPKLINQPHQVPMVLADNLPKSSTFYLTYFVLQGLGSSTKNVLNYSDLFFYLFYDRFINKTPREKYAQYTSLKGIGWGKVYPKFTNFIVIALAYSCISPLVLGFATIGLALFLFTYRYNLLFVVQPKLETKGLCYTNALKHIITGVYVGELCLIGLFSLRKATGPTVLLFLLFIVTIAYNVASNRYLDPLEDHLPDKLLGYGDEDEPLLAAEEGQSVEEANERSRVQHVGQSIRVPSKVLDPVAQFFEPGLYASHKVMREFLRSAEEPDVPEYSEEQLRNAYVNPALTSKTPKIWLPADPAGVCNKVMEANEAEGIASTDGGAWMDEKGRVRIDEDDLGNTPLWKEKVPF